MRTPVNPARLKTPHIVVITVAAIVAVLAISGLTWAKKGVTVVVDGRSVYHTTEAKTVEQVLDEVSINVGEGDVVSPLPETPVADGSEIVVRRAVPVTVVRNGEPVEVRVIGQTVADALVAAGVDPSVGVSVTPDVNTELTADMTITATEMFRRIVKETVTLPYTTVEQQDPNLARGKRRVVQAGTAGEAIRVYEIVMVGSRESSRAVKTEEVIAQPVNAVVRVGTRAPDAPRLVVASAPIRMLTHASAVPAGGSRIGVSATAYTPWDPGCGGLKSITHKLDAYHVPSGWGIIAVDPSVIPLGTRVFVPGYGYAVAADTGGAISGRRIDVCFFSGGPTRAKVDALLWGRHTVTITVLR